MKNVAIIIPAYNEEKHISETLNEVSKLIDWYRSNLKIEVIVVNDCSSDNTLAIVSDMQRKHQWLKVFTNKNNIGLGGSYKRGLELANSEYITWVPADNSHGFESLKPAFDEIGMADMIIPVPLNPKVRPLGRRMLSRIYTYVINEATGMSIKYFNGLTIHRVNLLKSIEIETDGFGFQAEAIVKLLRKGATFQHVSAIIGERKSGRSKAFNFRNMLRVLKTIQKIRQC